MAFITQQHNELKLQENEIKLKVSGDAKHLAGDKHTENTFGGKHHEYNKKNRLMNLKKLNNHPDHSDILGNKNKPMH